MPRGLAVSIRVSFERSFQRAAGWAGCGKRFLLADRDVNFFSQTRHLVADSLRIASAGCTFYVGDIGQAVFAYAHDFKSRTERFRSGVQHWAAVKFGI